MHQAWKHLDVFPCIFLGFAGSGFALNQGLTRGFFIIVYTPMHIWYRTCFKLVKYLQIHQEIEKVVTNFN